MPSLRSVILIGLPLVSLGFAQNQVEENDFNANTVAEWKEIIRSLPGDSLKAALEGHLKPKYREGVFEDGHDAIDAVRSDDPELASKLVDLAKQDAIVKDYLRKRQDNSTSTPVETVTTTSPVVVTDSSTTAVSFTTQTTAVQTTTAQPPATSDEQRTTSQGQSSSPSSESETPAETSTSAPSSTTSPTIAAPTSAPETTIPITTTNQEGQTTVTSAVVSSVISANEPITEPTVSGGNDGSSPAQTTPPATQTGVLVPVQVTTTDDDGSTVVQITQAFQTEAPTSVAVQVTTTNDQGETITTSSIAPAVEVTTTNEQGETVTTASPISAAAVASGGRIVTSAAAMVTTTDGAGNQVVLSRPTPGGVYTTTDSRGRTVTVTYQPGGGTVSQLRLQTTTLPNGQRSTITSFAEVGQATADSSPQASGPSSSGSGKPGLQSGAAMPSSWYAAEFAMIVGAAIGVAGFVL